MTVFKFRDEVTVRISGQGDVVRDIKDYYGKLSTDVVGEKVDISCQVKEIDESPSQVLGSPERHYGRIGDRFLIKKHNNRVLLDASWEEIECAPATNHFFISYIIEFGVRRRLARQGETLIHASGVEINDRSLVFPAWQHTGKTNTMISLLQRHGGGYFSDDRLWVGDSGRVYGYPLPINMLSYNFTSFPGIIERSRVTKLRERFSEIVDQYVDRNRSFFNKVIYFLDKYYLSPKYDHLYHIDELLGDACYVDSASVDDVVLLSTLPDSKQAKLTEISNEEALDSLQTTSYYEWNQLIEEYCRIQDLLLPDSNIMQDFNELIELEEKVLRNFLGNADIHKLQLPREEEWNEKHLSNDVVELINTF